jgi:hypothetical protein
MAAYRRAQDGSQVAILFTLELVVSLNQQALVCLQNDDEVMASSFLKEALNLLVRIPLQRGDEFSPRTGTGFNVIPDPPLHGLTLLRIPSIRSEAPSLVVSIVDDGTFSYHHGIANAERILVALTLYHSAMAIHRGCCRTEHPDHLQLIRSRDLYDLCGASVAEIPAMKSLKQMVDFGVGHLCAMFEFPVAA